jgi:hypothetical protein
MKLGFLKGISILNSSIELLMEEKRKNTIFALQDGETLVEGDQNLLKLATKYYKELFGHVESHNIPLDPSLWTQDEKVSSDDNELLTKPFSIEEVKYALFHMECNKAAGPAKIPVEFLQTCWDIIKEDVMEMFGDFYENKLEVHRVNYGVITLLPKIAEACKIQQFRPICLLNFLYKWITKVLTMRLIPIAAKLICSEQTTFIKGRNIMTGVLALHEMLHETKRRQGIGVVLKLDFEKAYDKVSWKFLLECLKLRGFNDKWCGWIHQILVGGTVCVKMNDQLGSYFVSHKGARQGHPLSPLLFNFVADCLTKMVKKAQCNGLIKGLVDNLILNGVAILQYADDTIVCLKNDTQKARNMKFLLYLYEQMASLKTNFSKSEIFMINGDDSLGLQYAELFNCQLGGFPIRYLGGTCEP